MGKIKITTESTTDFQQYAKEFDVDIVHFPVALGEREGLDGFDVHPEDIYEYYERTKQLPKTAAVNEQTYIELFEKYKDYDAVIHITLSPAFSVTNANACRAAQKFKNVRVVNSLNLSSGLACLCIRASEMAKAGKNADEIVAALEALIPKIKTSFVIESLTFLRSSGRCSLLKLFGANLLKIRPQLDVIGGKIIPTKKFRGRYDQVVDKYVTEKFAENPNANKDFCFVVHTRMSDPAFVEGAIAKAKAAGFKRVFECTAGTIITCQCGAGTLGLCFLEN